MNYSQSIQHSRVALSLWIAALLLIGACTSNFDEVNTDQTKISVIGPAEIPYLFAKAQSSAALPGGNYQVGQNLFSDQYAQYFACVATYFPSDRYVIRMDWLATPWSVIYTQTVPQLKTIFEQTEPSSTEYALAQIWWVWSFHRVTDYYGPIPYFQAGIPATSVPYDPQDQIYDDFFKKLDSAVTVLESQSGAEPYGSFDLIYGGDVSKWIKFANTLRLRLAMRVSGVDPSRAQTEAEAAVAGGVLMSSPDDDALLQRGGVNGDDNALSLMQWNEFRMSAAMESVLKGYEDPRLEEYFDPSTVTGDYEGLRNGLTSAQLSDEKNTAAYNSLHNSARWNSSNLDESQNIMATAEAYFLRAEGALNGWNMGEDAKTLYNKGIEASMLQWGITDPVLIAAYQNSTATPIAPQDFLDSPPMADIPVIFAEDEATQREQIGTQKWLAMYPDGFEGWAEFRRTGYPTLYPVVNSDNPDIAAGEILRRIPFLDLEEQTNGDAVDAAVQLLDGPDVVTTPLWWDPHK